MAAGTIFALASGSGRAAVALIRISGPGAGDALDRLAGGRPPPRTVRLARLRDPRSGEVLDRALAVWFPAPRSFTGEDCAELHLHGGRAVVASVLDALGSLDGFVAAEPGAFTRRAFLNGRMDLAEVEGLADLIDAQTQAQRRQAVRQMEGAMGRWVAALRADLLRALAAAESAIDFADEGDVAGDLEAEVRRIAGDLDRSIARELDACAVAARVRDGVVVALTGPPNVGKSTLLNALARRDVAIVSPQAGTTRDAIEVQLDLGGLLVSCVDTAGLRDAADPVEQQGIARARARARDADLVLWLSDARSPLPPDADLAGPGRPLWTVATHADLVSGTDSTPGFSIAATSGRGLPALVAALREFAGGSAGGGEAGVATQARHRSALRRAREHLAPVLDGSGGMEIAAEQLRAVAHVLDALVGRVEPDEVLGEIFARFCIGK